MRLRTSHLADNTKSHTSFLVLLRNLLTVYICYYTAQPTRRVCRTSMRVALAMQPGRLIQTGGSPTIHSLLPLTKQLLRPHEGTDTVRACYTSFHDDTIFYLALVINVAATFPVAGQGTLILVINNELAVKRYIARQTCIGCTRG